MSFFFYSVQYIIFIITFLSVYFFFKKTKRIDSKFVENSEENDSNTLWQIVAIMSVDMNVQNLRANINFSSTNKN